MSSDVKVKRKFPSEVLPVELKNAIEANTIGNPHIIDLAYSSVLTTIGTVLSNKYQVKIKSKWIERSNLFTLCIAPSGLGKSNSMEHYLDVLDDYQANKLEQMYQNRLELFNEYTVRKKEVEKLIKNREGDDEVRIFKQWLRDNGLESYMDSKNEDKFKRMDKPERIKLISQKGTMQGKEKLFANNEGRSMLVYRDEFKGLIADLNRFSSGGDVEEFIKFFDYKGASTDNVSEENSRMYKEKTVSILGATQHKAFRDIFTENMIENGLFFRFLFVKSDNNEPINEFKVSITDALTNHLQDYEAFMLRMLNGYDKPPQRIELVISDEAWDYLEKWRDEMNENYNEKFGINTEQYNKIMGKMVSYIHRFAIIISRLRIYYEYDTEGYDKGQLTHMAEEPITAEDYQKASKLLEFYMHNTCDLLNNIEFGINDKFKDEKEFEFILKVDEVLSYTDLINLIMFEFKVKKRAAEYRLQSFMKRGIFKKNKEQKYYKVI